MKEALFEHRFWLQVLGDHARFLLNNLSPKETQEVQHAQGFITRFDSLLAAACQDVGGDTLTTLTRQAQQAAVQLRDFKLHVQRRQLAGKIEIALPPTFLNHMLNELEEYLRILEALLNDGKVPVFHPVHHHLLWLLDASGHAAALDDRFDPVEKKWKKKAMKFTKTFEGLYLKSVETAAFLRTRLPEFPALARLNSESELAIKLFQGFLAELQEMELTNSVLDTISPLIVDHMYREECYYLTKLAQVTHGDLPDCDPAKPRME